MAYDPHPTIEHGSTRGDRWLRAHAVPLAAGVAVLEGVLVLTQALEGWAVFAVAVAVVVGYLMYRDRLKGETRELARVIALSQGFVVGVVGVVLLVGALVVLAITGLVVLGLAALMMILRDRQR